MTSDTRVERVTHGPAPEREYIYDGNAIIAETDDYESAQRIVRAVNSHDELLAALEAVHGFIEEHFEWWSGDPEDADMTENILFEQMGEAIRRARGED